MSKESIQAIKKQLLGNNIPTKEYLDDLKQDSRIGVQKLLLQFDRKEEKQRLIEQKFLDMSEFEIIARQNGAKYIAGIDEVGRGPLAGPVVAAAVILPEEYKILGLNDSKQLSAKKREELFDKIQEVAIAIGVAEISSEEIDRVNIYEASKLAMIKAVNLLSKRPDHLLIDAMTLDLPITQDKIIKGDARSNSIAAASIIAKVTRDRMMEDYDRQYPGYDFSKNAGYGTANHLQGLQELGITPIHRKTFAPIKHYC